MSKSGQFDSEEERHLFNYFMELKAAGYVKSVTFEPHSFQLSDKLDVNWIKQMKTKNKPVVSSLMQEHIYTADFLVEWEDCARGIFFNDMNFASNNKAFFYANSGGHEEDYYSFIECKPKFDMHNMTRVATINVKWVWDKYGEYVQIVKPLGGPKALFQATFTPSRYRFTDKTLKPRKLKWKPRSLVEFVDYAKANWD